MTQPNVCSSMKSLIPIHGCKRGQKPIMVIVGELDTKEVKPGSGKTHVTQATTWVKKMNGRAEENRTKESVE